MTIGTSLPLPQTQAPAATPAPSAPAPAPANAPPEPGRDDAVRLGERPTTFSRSANPLTQMQRDQWAQAGAPNAHDNPDAAAVRNGFHQAADGVESEADTFAAQGAAAQKAGTDLEGLARQLGNGSHTGPYGDVNVNLGPNGAVSASQRLGSDNRSLDRQGDRLTVRTNGVEMTDTPAGRTIHDGDTTRTLHLQNDVEHHAGEFEVERDRGGAHDLTRVDGNSIQHDRDREDDSSSSKYSNRNGTVGFSDYRTRFNRSNRQTTTQFREVQVGQDGGTRVRQNDANDHVSETAQPGR